MAMDEADYTQSYHESHVLLIRSEVGKGGVIANDTELKLSECM